MNPESEKTPCPIPSTHERLHQSHRLWHQTLSEYSDPEGFCTNLNATIQALRSVTFVLQKEKSRIPDFADWYGRWQENLKEDSVMKWLKNARNRIEKEGGLNTHSIAKLSVLAGWDGYVVVAEQKVDPLASTDELVEKAKALELPPEVRRHGVLVVERMWVVQDFPERELLDLLAHSYGVLSTLLEDAHRQCGLIMKTFCDGSDGPEPVSDEHLGGRLPCMVAPVDARKARVHLAEGEIITPVRLMVKPDETRKEEILARYDTAEARSVARMGKAFMSGPVAGSIMQK